MNAIHQCAPAAPICGNARRAKAVRGFLALTVALTLLASIATNHSREQVVGAKPGVSGGSVIAGSKPSAAGGSAIAGSKPSVAGGRAIASINGATGNVQPPLSL